MPEPLLFTDALAVDTLAQLLALTPTSTPFPRLDGMWLLVREQRQYYLYSQSATTGGVAPNDSTGRWFPFGMTPTPIWTGTSLGWDTTGDGTADVAPVDLQGPQGIQGIQGTQGPEGPPGPAGDSGLPGTIAIRQAIQDAPVDADGRADFLTSSGLVVSGSGISSSSALILAITDTPNASGQPVDRVVKIASNPTWPTLSANTTSYGFIEDPDGTPAYSISTLAPSYGVTRPASPATGQFHYDIGHRGRAVVWDGSAWVERRIICVWEAVTGASTVTTLRSYPILSRVVIRSAGLTISTALYEYTTSIGLPSGLQRFDGVFNNISGTSDATNGPNGSGGYPVGIGSSLGGGTTYHTGIRINTNSVRLDTGTGGLWCGGRTAIRFTGADLYAVVSRTF
jgi:hypothetical protein